MPMRTNKEVLLFIDQHELMGQGLGYVDAYLRVCAQPVDALFWTRDKWLHTVASEPGLAPVDTEH